MKFNAGDLVIIDKSKLEDVSDILTDYQEDIDNSFADTIYAAVYNGDNFEVLSSEKIKDEWHYELKLVGVQSERFSRGIPSMIPESWLTK